MKELEMVAYRNLPPGSMAMVRGKNPVENGLPLTGVSDPSVALTEKAAICAREGTV